METDHLIPLDLKPELGSEPHQIITIGFQGSENFGFGFVENRCCDFREHSSVVGSFATTMGCPEEDDSNSAFADVAVSSLDIGPSECLFCTAVSF